MIVFQKDSQAARKRADKLMREADLVETDASETRKDAEGLDMMVNMAVDAVDAVDDAVKFAQVRGCFVKKIEAGRFKQRFKQRCYFFSDFIQKSHFFSLDPGSGSRFSWCSPDQIPDIKYMLSLNLTQNLYLAWTF